MWYLGFDCATKTFAYSLSHIDLTRMEEYKKTLDDIQRRKNVAAVDAVDALLAEAHKLDLDTKSMIKILCGKTINLVEYGSDYGTVSRIKSLKKSIDEHVLPAIACIPKDELLIVVEYQMGQNSDSRSIMYALVALFADYEIVIVGPSLKNKVSLSKDGKYSVFLKKYKSSYSANKAHAVYNFEHIVRLFTSDIGSLKKKDISHIADSFMQVVGFVLFGERVDVAKLKF